MNKTIKFAIKKVLRTLQSAFPSLKDAKDDLYLHGRRLLRFPHEPDFRALALVPASSHGCFIDVGANQGQSIESILLFRPDAQIVSFEANAGLAEKLKSRYRNQQKIRIVAEGLADSAGSFTLFVPSYNGFVYDGLASFDKATAASWINKKTILGFRPEKLHVAELECTTNTLDSHNLAPVFMKVDVEGYEYHVLLGGKATLRQYEPILLVENVKDDPRSLSLLRELGYEEYYFDGTFFRKGRSKTGNAFLITPAKLQMLLGSQAELGSKMHEYVTQNISAMNPS